MSHELSKLTEPYIGGRDIELLRLLANHLLPSCRDYLNSVALPSQFGVYTNDRIRTNQRNLTDIRTRLGVLFEYELAKAFNVVTESLAGAAFPKLSYIVANKYPDLAFRGTEGQIGVRFEVKAIEDIAEEKTANFDTLIKNIRKGGDYVVVILWGWTESNVISGQTPRIYEIYVFDAYELAMIRDVQWLNNPPLNLGSGRQGYDLAYAVNSSSTGYNKEEGNYGKLMRIFRESSLAFVPGDIRSGPTIPEYLGMRRKVIEAGLNKIISNLIIGLSSSSIPLASSGFEPPFTELTVARVGDSTIGAFGAERFSNIANIEPILSHAKCDYVIQFNGKFSWRVFRHDRDGRFTLAGENGSKPAGAYDWIRTVVRNSSTY